MKYCRNCGKEINENATFCKHCGFNLGQTQNVQNNNINNRLVCPKCGSTNVTFQVVNEAILKNKHKSIIWWICIGWWWMLIKWLLLTLPALFIKVFGLGHKNQKIKNVTKKKAVCQNCGNFWEVK